MRMAKFWLLPLAALFSAGAAQRSPGADVLQAALQAHGGASAAALSERAVYTGTWIAVRREGLIERSLTMHAGRRGVYRAEIASLGLERLFVSDGESAWVVDNGVKRSLPLPRSANLLFPFNPLAGLLAAVRDARLDIGAVRSEQGGNGVRTVVDVRLPDAAPRIPRARPLERRYEAAVDEQSGLVASLTLFTNRTSRLRDEPDRIYEYGDYREVQGMMIPFLVRVLSGWGDRLFELRLESFEPVNADPEVSEP